MRKNGGSFGNKNMKSKKLIQLIKTIRSGKRKAFICGNGGSACNAIHFAEDLMSRGVRAMALCDIGFLTATANDSGYKHVFSRPLKLWADEGDLFITLSCSGTSPNIVEAIKTAKQLGMVVFSFSTNKETKKSTSRTEDIHLQMIHSVYEKLK